MVLDRDVADRRRFAQLLGLADDDGSGLPVGSSVDDDPVTGSATVSDRDGTVTERSDTGRSGHQR